MNGDIVTVDVVITLTYQDHILYHYHQDTKELVLSGYIEDTNHYNYGVINGTCDASGYPLSVCLVESPYAITSGAHVECTLLGSYVNVNGHRVYDVVPIQSSMPLTRSISDLESIYNHTKQHSIQEYREAKQRYINIQTPIQRNKITNYFMPIQSV